MLKITRRDMLRRCAVAGGACVGLLSARRVLAAPQGAIRFTVDLRCGSIGVRAGQREAIDLALRHGFESVTPEAGYLAQLSDQQAAELVSELTEKKLKWGAVAAPPEDRGDQKQATQNEMFHEVPFSFLRTGCPIGSPGPGYQRSLTQREHGLGVKRIRSEAPAPA